MQTVTAMTAGSKAGNAAMPSAAGDMIRLGVDADEAGREITLIGDKLFSDKRHLDTLWQMIAEEVWPFRATFTVSRTEGDDFSRHLVDSKPVQNVRDVANVFGELIRPAETRWFIPMAKDPWRNTESARSWFDKRLDDMRTYIYGKKANFSRTMNVGDYDLVCFGNAVSSLTENKARNGFINLDHHLRNCAWSQDSELVVNHLHRKFMMSLRNMRAKWGPKCLSPAMAKMFETNPFHEVEVRHAVLPRDDYGPFGRNPKFKAFPFVSIYYLPSEFRTLEQGGYHEFPYIVRRWFATSESAYAHSPATMIGLVDARLLQAQSHVIIDAGERAVDPPTIATRGAVIGEVNTYAGMTTWIDAEYDERLGAALKTLESNADIGVGLKLKQDTREVLDAAMFINKLNLPGEKDMTAYEVGQRLEEYLRTLKPVIRPFRSDNAIFLDVMFQMLMRITISLEAAGQMGPFSPLSEVPQELRGADIEFEFDGPVEQAYRKLMRNEGRQVMDMTAEAMKLDASIADNLDKDKVYRTSIESGIAPQAWLVPEKEVAAKRAQRAQQMAEQQKMEQLAKGAEIAKSAGQAAPGLVQGAEALKGMQGQGQQQQQPPQEEQGSPFDYLGDDLMGDPLEGGSAAIAA